MGSRTDASMINSAVLVMQVEFSNQLHRIFEFYSECSHHGPIILLTKRFLAPQFQKNDEPFPYISPGFFYSRLRSLPIRIWAFGRVGRAF